MKNILILFFSAAILAACSPQGLKPTEKSQLRDKELDAVFDSSRVRDIRITISSNEWNRLLIQFDSNHRYEQMVSADVEIADNGKTVLLTNVGFRVRGNSFSRERPEKPEGGLHNPEKPKWNRAHFKLDFSENVKKQRWNGLRGVNLKWNNGDPTQVRELYSYDLFRRFGVFTASRACKARLFIRIREDAKDVNFGVYTLLESLDSEFVKERFPGQENGWLWKCLWPADFVWNKGVTKKMGLEEINPTNDKLSKRYAYDLKTMKEEITNASLIFADYLKSLNEKTGGDLEGWLESHVDVDLFLRAMAVNTLLGMWDDYWNNQNNFYVYLDRNLKLYFIPYDYDNVLGTSGGGDIGAQNVFKWGPVDKTRPLIAKVLSIPKYLAVYSNDLAQLIDSGNGYFDITASTNRIAAWQSLIAPYVNNDTGQDTNLVDHTAYWGNGQFYKLFSGDEWGGPMDANWFLTRSKNTAIQLGLRQLDPVAAVDIRVEGVHKHAKGYQFVVGMTNSVVFKFTPGEAVRDVHFEGDFVTNLPAGTSEFRFNLPEKLRIDRKGAIPSFFTLASLHDTNGDLKRQVIRVLRFQDTFKSPEIEGNSVTFRYFTTNSTNVEILGEFNKWGEKNHIWMTNSGEGIWEFTTNKTFIKSGTFYLFHSDSNRWAASDPMNTNQEMAWMTLSLYNYQTNE